MDNISKVNKIAWEYHSYEFWKQYNGDPVEFAKRLISNPEYALRRHIALFDGISGKKIANPLGSNGRKAVPLALLGGDVTVIDISEGNRRYATELAEAAGVKIRYELCDFLKFDVTNEANKNYDILYLEGGILHYFNDIDQLMEKLYCMLKEGGRIILNDSHPFRKVIHVNNNELVVDPDYFNKEIRKGEVAYAHMFEGIEAEQFPKCQLRFYTVGEIITSAAEAGFHIDKFIEDERYDHFKGIPGSFTLLATKVSL